MLLTLQVLGVSRDEVVVNIRTAKNRRLLCVHPDKAKCPGGHEAGVRVNEVRTPVVARLTAAITQA